MTDSNTNTTPYAIVDLHCDLLSYLATVEGAGVFDTDDIGCAVPHLRDGNVKLQVLASYVPKHDTSAEVAADQYRCYNGLPSHYPDHFHHVTTPDTAATALELDGTGIVVAIENASALCNETESLDSALNRLGQIVALTRRVLYITLTHHGENRFGGGNMTDTGLKDDGKVLLEHMHGRGIAIDFSHTSDALARGILDHIDSKGLDIPVLASHSNFRAVFDHARNLPDWLAKEVVSRGGVVGINFIRAFVHPEDPSYLTRHIMHGHELELGDGLCFGADFFYWKGSLDQGRVPFYHPAHENAGVYQDVLDSIGSELGDEDKQALANGNALRFLDSLWR